MEKRKKAIFVAVFIALLLAATVLLSACCGPAAA